MIDPSDTLKAFFNELGEVWGITPKPVKVFIYLFASGSLTIMIDWVAKLELENAGFAMIMTIINVALVSGKQAFFRGK